MTVQARGCGGSRVAGGLYLVTKLFEGGRLLEDFLIDPPVIVPESLNIPMMGMGWFQREEKCLKCNGTGRIKAAKHFEPMTVPCHFCQEKGTETVTHIADHIGSSHYPNVVDDIEEVRAIGSSRRIASTFPFHLLTSRSRHFRCHSRAYIENHEEYLNLDCPKHIEEHQRFGFPDMCIGHLWEDYEIQKGQSFTQIHPLKSEIRITIPCGKSFTVRRTPEEVTPLYQRAFYMALPITGIEAVIPKGLSTRDELSEFDHRVAKASQSKITVQEVDE